MTSWTLPRPRRIAIVDHGIHDPRWTAGSTYTRVLAHSLGQACQSAGIELCLLSADGCPGGPDPALPGIRRLPRASPRYFRGEWRLRRFLGLADKSDLFSSARAHAISVLLPLLTIPAERSAITSIGWIPDFQHVHLPEYFSEAECQTRDAIFRQLAIRASRVLLSSRNALKHFQDFLPEQAHKGRVSSFPSILAFEPFPSAAPTAHRTFNVPDRFALIANQFWRHKNHLIVLDAIRLLRRGGLIVPVVMVGLPADYRDPANRTVSQVLQAIALWGLSSQVTMLGLVSRDDLVSLLRTATVIIQPSRFEGWSTIVEDCKALGRPLICSDIPVHREQAPDALGFFPCDQATVLADVLAGAWERLQPGPDLAVERLALAIQQDFARGHGETLLSICEEAYAASP